MKPVVYQVNEGGIVSILPDGRVEMLAHEALPTLQAIAEGRMEAHAAHLEPFILREAELSLENFHLKAPAIAFIELTNLCNLRCTHCYAFSGLKRSKEMSTERILALIDELADLGTLQLFLTGGEIFAHPDAVKIISHAMTKSFSTQVFTNGLLITEEKLAQLPKGVSFFISFDTSVPERTVRGGMDYPKLRERFEWMKKHGHVFRTAISVHNKNVRDIEGIFRWCIENGYPRPQWSETHPVGRALIHPEILMPERRLDEVFEVYRRCMEAYSEFPSEPGSRFGMADIRDIGTFKFCQRLEQATSQEKCGRSVAYINSSGDVFPCSNCMSNGQSCGGNVHEKEFAAIWEEGFRPMRETTYEDYDQCRDCPVLKAGIWCQFRCTALAKNVSGRETGCGATPYIKAFMLKTDQYWKERQRAGIRLRLQA